MSIYSVKYSNILWLCKHYSVNLVLEKCLWKQQNLCGACFRGSDQPVNDFYPISFSRLLLINSLYLSISLIVIILKMIAYQDSFPYHLYFRDIPRSARVIAWFQPESWKGHSSNTSIIMSPCDCCRDRGRKMESRPCRREESASRPADICRGDKSDLVACSPSQCFYQTSYQLVSPSDGPDTQTRPGKTITATAYRTALRAAR